MTRITAPRHSRHQRSRSQRSRSQRSRRAGFTLLEMMVALVIGALVVTSMITLGAGSQRHFQEQQRIGVTQRSVRLAMDRLRRDVGRAGYLHVPSTLAPRVNNCSSPAAPGALPAVWMADDDTAGNSVLDAVNRSRNGVSADRLRLIGSYDTSDPFLVRDFNAAGTSVTLQTINWLAFARNFVVDIAAAPTLDATRFAQVFQTGRFLHIETRKGQHIYVRITGATLVGPLTAPQATINFAPSVTLGVPNGCFEGLGEQSVVSVLNMVEYSIQAPQASSTLVPRSAAVVGANTQLIRQELNIGTGAVLANTRRVVLEFAVDFNVDAFVDLNLAPGVPPNIQLLTGPAAQVAVQGTPWQVRSLQVSLAARTPEQDSRFPWPYGGARPGGTALNRFQVFTGQPGAARVRQLTTEVMMPNMVPR